MISSQANICNKSSYDFILKKVFCVFNFPYHLHNIQNCNTFFVLANFPVEEFLNEFFYFLNNIIYMFLIFPTQTLCTLLKWTSHATQKTIPIPIHFLISIAMKNWRTKSIITMKMIWKKREMFSFDKTLELWKYAAQKQKDFVQMKENKVWWKLCAFHFNHICDNKWIQKKEELFSLQKSFCDKFSKF